MVTAILKIDAFKISNKGGKTMHVVTNDR